MKNIIVIAISIVLRNLLDVFIQIYSLNLHNAVIKGEFIRIFVAVSGCRVGFYAKDTIWENPELIYVCL